MGAIVDLVSAVIPTRNRPGLLVKAVSSVLRQSYPLMEVIVVIDGQDCATEAALAEIEDLRLRVIALSGSVGGSEARNIGVEAARGEWIAFLDDDDEWFPEKIALQLEAAASAGEKYPVVSSRMIAKTPTAEFIWPLQGYEKGIVLSEYLFCRRQFVDGGSYLQTSTLLMRRELMKAIPFRAGLKMHQDWDWLLRAAKHPDVTFSMVATPLVLFRMEDARESVGRVLDWDFSMRWAREMREYFTPRAYSFFLAAECASRAANSRAGAAVYGRIAWEFFTRGRPTGRAFVMLAAFVGVPLSVRMWMRERLRRIRIANESSVGRAAKQGRAAALLGDTTI